MSKTPTVTKGMIQKKIQAYCHLSEAFKKSEKYMMNATISKIAIQNNFGGTSSSLQYLPWAINMQSLVAVLGTMIGVIIKKIIKGKNYLCW